MKNILSLLGVITCVTVLSSCNEIDEENQFLEYKYVGSTSGEIVLQLEQNFFISSTNNKISEIEFSIPNDCTNIDDVIIKENDLVHFCIEKDASGFTKYTTNLTTFETGKVTVDVSKYFGLTYYYNNYSSNSYFVGVFEDSNEYIKYDLLYLNSSNEFEILNTTSYDSFYLPNLYNDVLYNYVLDPINESLVINEYNGNVKTTSTIPNIEQPIDVQVDKDYFYLFYENTNGMVNVNLYNKTDLSLVGVNKNVRHPDALFNGKLYDIDESYNVVKTYKVGEEMERGFDFNLPVVKEIYGGNYTFDDYRQVDVKLYDYIDKVAYIYYDNHYYLYDYNVDTMKRIIALEK